MKFLLLLHLSKERLFDVIKRDNGRCTLKSCLAYINNLKKEEKCKLDIDFLVSCKTYEIFPKFLRFKLYKKSLHSSSFYKSWQNKLLDEEIQFKKRRRTELKLKCDEIRTRLRQELTFFKFFWLLNVIDDIVSTFKKKHETIHDRKLRRIGIDNSLHPCDPNKVIFNLSSKTLSSRIKILLAFGVDFKLPVWKLNFFDYFLHFESLIQSISSLPLPPRFDFQDVKQKIRITSHKFFDTFKPSKVFSPIFSKSDIKLLKDFASDDSIVVTRPDKGKGVVILDRDHYVEKVSKLLSDNTKFCSVREPLHKLLLRVEDKVNRLLNKLKKRSVISDSTYNELHASGSTPGILYGLPKIHKLNVPVRPIFRACGTATYALAKFLVPLLSPISENEFTVKNSYEFVESVRNFQFTEDMVMASFDVESLFTNIPVTETVNIALDSLFSKCKDVKGISRDLLHSMLDISVTNSYFLFNQQLYKQLDGVGMGLPLGPTFANIFLCFHEKNWLAACPPDFRPVLYKRYVDDCFLVFNHMSHVDKFLNFLNTQHPKIKFTKEVETNGILPFLDVTVRRAGTSIETSVYRKPSFTGLGLSFFSFVPLSIKNAVVQSFIYRAYRISSNYKLFHLELNFLKKFFKENGYPRSLIESAITNFLNMKFTPVPVKPDVNKLKKFIPLPYFGKRTNKLKKEVDAILRRFYPYLDPRIVLRNSFTIGSLFKFKDCVPKACRSAVVYKFSCPSCEGSYIGSTYVRLISRVCQHQGKSDRTGERLSSPVASSIRDHSLECDTPFTIDNFRIVDRKRHNFNLRILESLYICKNKPTLNDKSSAYKLSIAM